ncbi:MAG: hypothetical protein IT534_06425 [Bauldia sp.]|nr:hypothetical protein [Bauldia sp.]
MFRTLALAAAATLALGLGPAVAQDYTLAPINGATKLAAGFAPDPLVVDVQAGGDVDAYAVTACTGLVMAAPAYRLFYTAGDAPLTFSVTAAIDTTLVISDPVGNWVCNDDFDGLNPAVIFETPLGGQYDIWVGTYSKNPPVTVPLTITGATSVVAPVAGTLDYNLEPVFGTVDIDTGFTPDPHVTDITVGGPVDIAATPDMGDACWGFTTAEPTLRLNYVAGSTFPLYIYAVAESSDIVLAVNNPDGTWFCDDDSAGNLDPLVTFDAPITGQYDIWVGTYGEGNTTAAQLFISEVNAGPAGGDNPTGTVLNWDLEPLFGQDDLPAGFALQQVDIAAGGTISPTELGDACAGYVTEAPTYRIYYEGTAPLTFTVEANGADTTLVVADPDGFWLCNDDGEATIDPTVVMEPGYTGQYDIWVGTFAADGTTAPATLTITEGEVVPALNWDLDPTFGATDMGAGGAPSPVVVAVEAGGTIDVPAALPGEACTGYTTTQSTHRINYVSSGRSLTFAVTADADTTLIIADPAGAWFCNDDFDGLNPGIVFDAPADGPYDVWVAMYDSTGQLVPATLTITEGDTVTPPPEVTLLDGTLAPIGGMTDLTAGFAPDPFVAEVAAGGEIEAYAAVTGTYCFGFVTEAPTYLLNYTAGAFPLTVRATSERDTTLVIQGPDGTFTCDDDTNELNPEVSFPVPATGAYAIWVGTYAGDGTQAPATLEITELGATGDEVTLLDWALDPVSGTGTLAAGFTPDPFAVEVAAGGDVLAMTGTGDDNCWGYVTVGPTYRLNYSGGGPLGFLAQSETDTVLVISDPDGNWVCADDEGGDYNPAVFFEDAPAGQYDIWVGTFSQNTVPATLTITATSPVAALEPIPSVPPPASVPPIPTVPPAPDVAIAIDPTGVPAFGETTLNAGFSPDPVTVDVTGGGPIEVALAIQGGGCVGWVPFEPTYRLTYAAASWPLILSAVSEADLTLVVRTPDGQFLCNDDTNGANPAVRIEQPTAGAYEIWVGTYAPGPAQAATLFISEISAGP